MEFSVTLQSCRGPGDDDLDEDRISDLAGVLPSAAVTVGQEVPLLRYGSTFLVEGSDAFDAIHGAEKLWAHAHQEVGLGDGWPVCRADAVLYSELVDDLDRPNFPDLVGIAEIAQVIGASRQRAHALARSSRFPSPAAELLSGPVFLRSSVEAFLETWDRRPGRPRKVAQ